MAQKLAQIAIVVSDYDEAIEYYTKKLGFVLVEDTKISDTKRWVVVAPPGGKGCSLLLAKAANKKQQSRIGDQTGVLSSEINLISKILPVVGRYQNSDAADERASPYLSSIIFLF